MAKKTTIVVEGTEIRLLTDNQNDFISLTDLTQNFEGGAGLIEKWFRNRNTVEFLGMWEKIYNPQFNEAAFKEIANQAGLNTFMLSAKKWIERTGAVGITAKAGRGGGTYAHKDIALEICTWLSPLFKLYVVREFDRLKHEEYEQLALEWNVKRTLAKINYRIHTDAVKMHLIPPRITNPKQAGIVYASEADMLNIALFGFTAKGLPVGWMYREEPIKELDNGWRFFSGNEDQEYVDNSENSCIFNTNTIANYDRGIIPYLGLPVGIELERNDDGTFSMFSE